MDIKKVLEDHKLWLSGNGGKRADLRGADLHGSNLRRADLQEANLQRADLQGADLRRAKLQGANLRWANLYGSNLQEANLRRADLDFSCWPLCCGSIGVKLDDHQKAQLLYHALCNMDEGGHKMLFRYARAFVNKNFKQVVSGSVKLL